MKNKIIFHIDVDSFFVSVETWLRPELRDKDVAICKNKPKAVVCSLSHSAKQKGARVPMKLYEVKKFCPDIIAIEPSHNLYSKVSKRIYDFLKKNYTKNIEVGSIDEWYLDLTELSKRYKNLISLAKKIQKDLYENMFITVSIGISYNKFLAKMASELKKPNEISIINKNNINEIIWPLNIDRCLGIGKSLSIQLKKMNILTIGDLVNNKDEDKVKNLFKNTLDKYIDNIIGTVNDENIKLDNKSYDDTKSIGAQMTFGGKYLIDLKEIYDAFRLLSTRVCDILNKRRVVAYGVSIIVKYVDKQRFSSSIKKEEIINDENQIFDISIKLFNKLWNEKDILMIGVSVFDLFSSNTNVKNESLFNLKENNVDTNNKKINDLINNLNYKLGNNNLKLLVDIKDGDENEW